MGKIAIDVLPTDRNGWYLPAPVAAEAGVRPAQGVGHHQPLNGLLILRVLAGPDVRPASQGLCGLRQDSAWRLIGPLHAHALLLRGRLCFRQRDVPDQFREPGLELASPRELHEPDPTDANEGQIYYDVNPPSHP